MAHLQVCVDRHPHTSSSYAIRLECNMKPGDMGPAPMLSQQTKCKHRHRQTDMTRLVPQFHKSADSPHLTPLKFMLSACFTKNPLQMSSFHLRCSRVLSRTSPTADSPRLSDADVSSSTNTKRACSYTMESFYTQFDLEVHF